MRLPMLSAIVTFIASYTLPAWCQAPGETASSSPTDEVSDEEFNLPVDDELAAQIKALILQLGSPLYQERETATKRLLTIGAPAFARLRNTYHETDELEVRLRIEGIVHEAYLNYHVYGRNAFLGISQSPIPRVHEDDPRIPEGHFGVQVGRVIGNTAAEKSGIQKGDVIIALDGEPLKPTGVLPNTAFGESIRLRGPGAMVTLTILRGPRKFDMDVTLGRRPKQYYIRQGLVTEMLVEAGRQFGVWWIKHFRQTSPESYGDGGS